MIKKSTICDKTSNSKLGWRKKIEMTNNTTRNPTIIALTYIKLAQPKPYPNYSNKLNNGTEVPAL